MHCSQEAEYKLPYMISSLTNPLISSRLASTRTTFERAAEERPTCEASKSDVGARVVGYYRQQTPKYLYLEELVTFEICLTVFIVGRADLDSSSMLTRSVLNPLPFSLPGKTDNTVGFSPRNSSMSFLFTSQEVRRRVHSSPVRVGVVCFASLSLTA